MCVRNAGLSASKPSAMLPTGSFLAGLGGLAYHMAQFNVAQLYPAHKGLVSSLYVGTFISSGIVFEIVRAAFVAAGSSAASFRNIMVALAALGVPISALMLWMSPRRAFSAGQQFRFEADGMRFRTDETGGAAGAGAADASARAQGLTSSSDFHKRAVCRPAPLGARISTDSCRQRSNQLQHSIRAASADVELSSASTAKEQEAQAGICACGANQLASASHEGAQASSTAAAEPTVMHTGAECTRSDANGYEAPQPAPVAKGRYDPSQAQVVTCDAVDPLSERKQRFLMCAKKT